MFCQIFVFARKLNFGVEPKIKMGLIDPYYAIPLVGTPLYEYGKQLGLIGQQLAQVQPGAFPTQTVGYAPPAAPASPMSQFLGGAAGIGGIAGKLGLFG